MRRTEGSDVAATGLRRWALRAGLVLAAGAAGLAVSAGSAQADTGLGGTLDHVVGTVSTATGGSHSGHHATKASKPQAASATRRTQARRSPVAAAVRTTTRTVARPVVKPVVRDVVRPVVKPVVRTTTKAAAPKAHRQDPPRHATKPAARPSTKPSTKPVTRPLAAAELTLVDLRVDLPAVTVPSVVVGQLEVAVQVPRSVDVTVSPDLSGVIGLGTTAPVVSVRLPDLAGVQLPGVQLPGVQLPGVDVPGTVVPTPQLPGAAAPAEAAPRRIAADFGPVVRTAGPSEVGTVLTDARPADATATTPRSASAGVDRASTTSGLPGIPAHPAPALDLSVVPSGAATGGAANGALLLGVAVAAALTVDRTALARALAALVTEASRLVRQPGFAPD